MLFADDTEASLRAAVALVNSAAEPDTLTEIGQLDAFYEEHGYTGRHDRDAAELRALRALRPVLRELLTAERDDAAAARQHAARERESGAAAATP